MIIALWLTSSFLLVSSQTLQPESLIQDANIIEFYASDYDHEFGEWPSTDNLYRFANLPTSEYLDDESVHFDGSVVATVDYDISPSNAEQLTIEIDVFVHSTSPALNDYGWFIGHDDGGYDRSIHFHDTRFGGDVNNPMISLGVGKAYTSTVPCPLDTWFTLHAVWENDKAYVYIDGELRQTITGAASGDGHPNFSVGGLVQFGNHETIADLYSLRVYDVALSQDDISTGTLTLFGDESVFSDDAKSTVSCPYGYEAQSCACLGTVCEGEYFSTGEGIPHDWSGPTSGDVCVAHRRYSEDSTGVVAAVTCYPGQNDHFVNVESAPNGNGCDYRDSIGNMCAGDRTATCPDGYAAVDCNCLSYWIQCPAQNLWQMDETSCSFDAPGKALAQVRCVDVGGSFTVEFQVSSWPDQLNGNGQHITQLAELSFYDESGNLTSPVSVSPLGCSDSPDGEGPSMAADEDPNTKWLTFQPCSLVYEFPAEVFDSLAGYNIMTANDFPERDPKSWVILKAGEIIAQESSQEEGSPYDRQVWISDTNYVLPHDSGSGSSSDSLDFFGSSYDPASCHPETLGLFDPDGTWKGRRDFQRQCKKGNLGRTAFSEHWSLIQTHSQFFAASDCASGECICDILSISGKTPDCERTAAFLMTLALNFVEGNLTPCVCVEHSVAGTVEEVWGYVDDLLAATDDLTWQQCLDASNAIIDIDEGESIVECSTEEAFSVEAF